MKITCEYCGCYIEVGVNNLCPCCAAPLGESIRMEEERLKKKAEEKAAVEAAKAADEAEAAARAAREQAKKALKDKLLRAVVRDTPKYAQNAPRVKKREYWRRMIPLAIIFLFGLAFAITDGGAITIAIAVAQMILLIVSVIFKYALMDYYYLQYLYIFPKLLSIGLIALWLHFTL